MTTVHAYANEFQSITSCVPNMSDDDQHRWFLCGLSEKIRKPVEIARPQTYNDARQHALAEDIDFSVSIQHTNSASHHVPAPPPCDPLAMDVDAFQAPCLNHLSDGEHNHLHQVGTCFKCCQPGHISRFCPQGHTPHVNR
ncbi:hypothetical protein BX661DRAFT_67123 [Kickxella alabastrina]|uniref:uncharacterized protein n=1 Tax=Kickxella alabastrina TaxID=61397 RepID=UPI00221F3C72|nr:uncharacterized protein BX661DRAFT_67123 [Kickxella alabastrina]KAI7833977.1 hypothetical protein BX661DRAFT_67123 [Kickxella alabastrina]